MRDRHSACEGCYWYEQCAENRPCDYYYPIDDMHEDIVEEVHESRRRQEYYDEYLEYIHGWG